jgi:hypothetical protein
MPNWRKTQWVDQRLIGKLHFPLILHSVPSSCLALQFVLQRDSARYIAEKYLPSTLAMIFSWVAPYVFLLSLSLHYCIIILPIISYVPYNYEEVRIITPITVLLTLVQMEKGSQEVGVN